MAGNSPKTKRFTGSRQTRSVKLDRAKRPIAAPSDKDIENWLHDFIHPATLAAVSLFHELGLRARILNLPIMVASVLTMLWRQIGGVSELARMLTTQGFLWVEETKISQQAVSDRLQTLRHELFYKILMEVLPVMHQRFKKRTRELPEAIAWAISKFSEVYALDGSTLDVLMRDVKSSGLSLAGRMAALVNVASQLPVQIWYEEDCEAHDQLFWEPVCKALEAGTLLLFDMGFINYPVFDRLTKKGVAFITRAKVNTAIEPIRDLARGSIFSDQIVILGWRGKRCKCQMRLVQMKYEDKWYRYLTNVLDPEILPMEYVVALYWQRWRIEDAFKIVKRLLGLSYFYSTSQNAIQVQLWATWLLYALLADMTDSVADRLHIASNAISLEMVYRSLYFYTYAHHRGESDDVIEYLAANAKLFGLIKRKRRQTPEERIRHTLAQDA